MKKIIRVLILSFCALSCATSKNAPVKQIKSLKFIGEYLLPDKTDFAGTRVGGLSGIDYNPADSLYYLISDDRSEYNPARYYTARIVLSEKGIAGLRFVNVVSLRQKSGSLYPSREQDSLYVPDPEGLRLNVKTGEIVWSNEGERIVRNGYAILQNPSVNLTGKNGLLKDTFVLPPNLHVSAREAGPRRNGVFEGLTFADDFKALYVNVEEPLYEDGPRAGLNDSTAWIRIIKYKVQTKSPVAQFAYRIDPVAREPIPKGAFKINGVPDILAVNNHQLLVTERSFSSGYRTCNVKVYLAEITGAEDVSAVASLNERPPGKWLEKRLLLNMDDLGINVYNIEGASFGPRLPNGKRSLLFVADDNFSGEEKTQFLLFEIEE